MVPHTDDINKGVSYIVAIGDYTGGRLNIFKDGKGSPPVQYDIHNRFLRFNGQTTHSVEPIGPPSSGDHPNRISFVLYRRKGNTPQRKPVEAALNALQQTPSHWDTSHLSSMPPLHQLLHKNVAITFDKSDPKSYKRTKSRSRYNKSVCYDNP